MRLEGWFATRPASLSSHATLAEMCHNKRCDIMMGISRQEKRVPCKGLTAGLPRGVHLSQKGKNPQGSYYAKLSSVAFACTPAACPTNSSMRTAAGCSILI